MLRQKQVEQYRCDGYLFPFPALSAAELAECNAGLARYEQWLGKPVNQGDFRWRSASYVILPWVDALARHPRILDAVEDLIGPDILVYTATWFIKEAHAALRLENSINGAGQAIVEQFEESGAAMMELPAGSFSLHHTLCRHRSAPNRAEHRRVGIGISYIPAQCRLTGSVRMCARLVGGHDSGGNFDLIPPPEGELHPAALERHERVYGRYRDNYAEQIAAHERAFAAQPA